MAERGARFAERDDLSVKETTSGRGSRVTIEVPDQWFVMLRDEAAAGKVIVPLKPFLRFNKKMARQVAKLERRIRKSMPQLVRRGQLGIRESNSAP